MNLDVTKDIEDLSKWALRKSWLTEDYETSEDSTYFVGFSIRREGDKAIVTRVRFATYDSKEFRS